MVVLQGSDMSMFMSQAMPSAQMTPGQPMYQASSSDQQSAGNKTNTQPQQKVSPTIQGAIFIILSTFREYTVIGRFHQEITK